ncbi:MAG: NADH-quinone oxidoreductase subunit D [Polyangiaceae bacterium]|nr:NADH-quinone oxidoreductase subunit D [Polyangiaceae bacterium]MCW5791647.1 NADH-quinone oxidoreductase subunit D [Polyangiaceae bacterium]
MEPLDIDLDSAELDIPAEPALLNVGPAHPAMHGTVRIVMELSGETILKADVQVGYLHRGFEKMCERGTWSQVFPYVDRCNYVSPMLNNVAFALACEKMLGVQVPVRCQHYRVILGELARMSDHLTCTGAMAMELGAFTPFLWLIKAREMIWDLMEEETGARLTHSFGRVGGMAKPPTSGFKEHALAVKSQVLEVVAEAEKLLLGNRIFLDRLDNVGVVSAEDAVSLGWTGPCLRASGVAYDVRKAAPYMTYGQYDFEVPVGTRGDCYDRFVIRLEEVRQSARIIEQAVQQMPDEGPIDIDDPRIVLPPKDEVYTTIEGTIQHFKIVMEGLKIPAGEVYSYTEGGNGELGFYLVSDGSGTPYRVRIRPPCFLVTAGLEKVITGEMMSDVVPCFGSLNMIGGECDR